MLTNRDASFLQSDASSLVIDERQALQEHGIATITCLLSGIKFFTRSIQSHAEYHRVISGVHGLHIYATEHWIDYLLSRQKLATGSTWNSSLFNLASRLAHTMDGFSVLSGQEESEIGSENADERLAMLCHDKELYRVVATSLKARSLRQLESSYSNYQRYEISSHSEFYMKFR